MEKFKVVVNNDQEFLLSKEQIASLDIQELSPYNFHVLKGHRSYKADLQKSDFLKKNYSVKINSHFYDVKIYNELDLLIEDMGLSAERVALVDNIKAPMPGLILELQVKEGDCVNTGDYLVVLEAMKMENTLTAPHDGVIKSIKVKKGQTVEKNQLLIELE